MSPIPPGELEQQGPPILCSSCGFVLRPHAKFCSNCGQPLLHQPPPPTSLSASSDTPSQSVSTKTGSRRIFEQFVELWWFRIPTRLRRSSVLLSEIWRDGFYLSISSVAATLLPFQLFFIGALEGIIHGSILTNPSESGETLVPFTQLFPLLLLTVAASAFSMNFGLTIVLGYALGDLLHTAFDVQNPSLAEWYATPQTTVLNIYVPHLVSYVIFALLVVLPTLYAKALTQGLHRLFHSKFHLVVFQAAVGACIMGGMVYAWLQATPLMIRTFWGWGWYTLNTTPAAMYYLQQPEMSSWLVWIAVIAFVLRKALEYRASRNPAVREREERLCRGLKEADEHTTVLRRLPPYVRALVPAVITTLVLGGILTDPREGLIFFLFLWFLLIMRGTILPRFSFWASWAQLVAHVPVLVRLLAALFVLSLLAWGTISPLWNQTTLSIDASSATFAPYLLTTGIAVIMMALLLPQTRQQTQPGRKPTS